jgi:hypothetical protein
MKRSLPGIDFVLNTLLQYKITRSYLKKIQKNIKLIYSELFTVPAA